MAEKPPFPYELSFGDDGVCEGYCDADALWRAHHTAKMREVAEKIRDIADDSLYGEQRRLEKIKKILDEELSKLEES